MLDGWYCRSMANQNATRNNDNDDDNEPNVVDDSDESQEDIPVARLMPRIDYKAQYTALKKKLKFLLYVSNLFYSSFYYCEILLIYGKIGMILNMIGKWILPRCVAVKPTTIIESNKGPLFFTRSIVTVRKTWEFWVG